jgi:transposase
MKRGRTKAERLAQEPIRMQVVQRVLAGESISDLSSILGYARQTIHRWVSMYEVGGKSALRSTKAIGATTKLTEKQAAWITATLISKNPAQLKFPFALWTREIVRELIRRRFGVSMALTSVGNLLRRLGFTVQRPLIRAYERNPVAVERWLKVDYPAIRAQAKEARGIIFFGDESGIRSDYHSGATWAPRGKTPTVLRTGKRVSCNMLSAVSARGELRFMVRKGGVGAAVFIQFIKRLMHGVTRPIFLIVDGHPSHRAKMTKRFVESLNGKLRLFFLPGYSPDLNPDELVWRQIKHHDIGRQLLEDADELTSKVYRALRCLQRRPETVRSFFATPTTCYAGK